MVFVTIFGIVGGVSWAPVNAQQTAQQEDGPNPVPKLMIQEQVRDAVMAFIGSSHEATLQFMSDLTWTGGREETSLLGAETCAYQSGGWNVTIKYPVVPNPTYNITVEYSTASNEPSIPYHIAWQGTWQDGCVTEASFVFAV